MEDSEVLRDHSCQTGRKVDLQFEVFMEALLPVMGISI